MTSAEALNNIRIQKIKAEADRIKMEEIKRRETFLECERRVTHHIKNFIDSGKLADPSIRFKTEHGQCPVEHVKKVIGENAAIISKRHLLSDEQHEEIYKMCHSVKKVPVIGSHNGILFSTVPTAREFRPFEKDDSQEFYGNFVYFDWNDSLESKTEKKSFPNRFELYSIMQRVDNFHRLCIKKWNRRWASLAFEPDFDD